MYMCDIYDIQDNTYDNENNHNVYIEMNDKNDKNDKPKKTTEIELKPYCNDKYSNDNIVILVNSVRNRKGERENTDKRIEYREDDWIIIS